MFSMNFLLFLLFLPLLQHKYITTDDSLEQRLNKYIEYSTDISMVITILNQL